MSAEKDPVTVGKRDRAARESAPRGTVLRFTADRKTIAFVGIYFALVLTSFIVHPGNALIAAPLVFVTCIFAFLGAVATHNTLHAPIFHSRGLNRFFQCVLTLTYGHPVSSFVPGHNLSHHKHTQTRRDVMRTTKVHYRWNLLNGIMFFPTVALAIAPADARYARAMKTRNPTWYQQLKLEWVCYFGYLAALVLLNWQVGAPWYTFLLYAVIPHQYAAFGIVTMNLLQHDGCDEHSDFNHSRNFVGRIANFLAYNNGYHTIHHMEAGLHWSLLPEEHARRVHPHIHPNLEQKNLITYLFATFLLPGRRLTWDGRPYVVSDWGPDEEWIPAPNETPKDVSFGAVAYAAE